MAKPVENPILPEHIELFELYVAKWQTLLNLNDWRIVRNKRGHSAYMAEVTSEPEHRLAKYKVGRGFGPNTTVTPESIESTALHEMLHVRLSELISTCFREQEHNDTVLAAEHAVIVVMERLLMKLATYASEDAGAQ